MKRNIIRAFLCGVVVLLISHASGQIVLSGVVEDASSGEPVVGASIFLSDLSKGTQTDLSGAFRLEIDRLEDVLMIRYIGYKTAEIDLKDRANESMDLGMIKLFAIAESIVGVDVIASVGNERITPVAMTTIKAEIVEKELGFQEYPEIMKFVPGVYATKDGGGTGDARLSIRGFQQENVALLINGIPVNSVESGQIFWNNWSGLSEATQFIQVQKGLGASKVAMNSVGGTVNIITKTTEAEPGGTASLSVTDYGNTKFNLSLNTGKLKSGYSISFLGSRTSGPGYVDATGVDSWSWFLAINKEFGKRHKLVFTGMGSPQQHGQNYYKMSHDEYDQYGNKFNYSWGSYNGNVKTLAKNFYHKPLLALNHYFDVSNKTFLATSA